MDQLIHPGQGRLEDHCIGRFCCDVAVVPECDADGRRLHRRRVVDAVAEEERGSFGCLFAHDRQLFFGARSRAHVLNADQTGQMLHFDLAVAGDQHHAGHLMPRHQVMDERAALLARNVLEPKSRRVLAVSEDDALHSRGNRRQLRGDAARYDLFAPGDLDDLAVDCAAQSLTRAFADLGDLDGGHSFGAGRVENAGGQRMPRILLQARGQP